MSAGLPKERRALGLAMREAEQAGVIEAPSELRQLVVSLPYTAAEIDRAFDLLVSPDGRTVGGTLNLTELDSRWIGRLVLAGIIEAGDNGDWELTAKGEVLVDLLREYADPRHVWTSLVHGSRELEGFAAALYGELLLRVWTQAAHSWHEQLPDRYSLGVVQGIEQALAAVDHVVTKFGIDPVEFRALWPAAEEGGEA